MTVEMAASVLAGEIFFGIIFALYLYKAKKRVKIQIVDK